MNQYNPIEIYEDEDENAPSLHESKWEALKAALRYVGRAPESAANATETLAKLSRGENIQKTVANVNDITKNLYDTGMRVGKVGLGGYVAYNYGPAALSAAKTGYDKLMTKKSQYDQLADAINKGRSVPSDITKKIGSISKNAAIGTAAAGAVALLIANNINKKYKWKVEGCDKLEGIKKQQCITYINNQKQKELNLQLKNCKFSNDPDKCESLLKNKLKGY